MINLLHNIHSNMPFVIFFVAISQLRGDPRLTTLDGLSYTFNGHGEFTLVRSTDGSDFVVQASVDECRIRRRLL